MKKKFLTGILATLACFACLTGCDLLGAMDNPLKFGDDKEVSLDALEGAKSFLQEKYKKENKEVRADYEVPNSIVIAEKTYTIEWSVDVTEGVKLIKGDESTIVDVDVTLSEDLSYVLTATLKDDLGSSVSVNFVRKVLALSQEVPIKISQAPAIGTAYKFHVYQGTLQQDVYIDGEMRNTYYFSTATNIDQGIDVYAEDAGSGKFHLYHNHAIQGKKYINIVKVDTHINAKYQTLTENETPSVWEFDNELQTMVSYIDETKYYLGADGSYQTVEPQKTVGDGYFVGYLVSKVNRANATTADKLEQTLKEISVDPVFVGENEVVLSSNENRTYPEVKITWTLAETTGATLSTAEHNESTTLTIAAPTALTTMSLTAKVTYDGQEVTKDVTVTAIPNTEEAILSVLNNGLLPEYTSFANEVTLTGTVTAVTDPYDIDFGNATVIMDVNGTEIECYHVGGQGASNFNTIFNGINSKITVTGTLKNYGGTIEFDGGCTISEYVAGQAPAIEELTISAALAKGNAMNKNEYTTEMYMVEGIVSEIDMKDGAPTNSMTIKDDLGNSIYLYAIKGDIYGTDYDELGAKIPTVGDRIKVAGVLGKYYNAQMKNGWIVEHEDGEPSDDEPEVVIPEADSEITVAQAIAIGNTFSKNNYTDGKYYLTATVASIDNASYGNITVKDADGNKLTIYGSTGPNGITPFSELSPVPAVNDTVKLYGVIGKFNAPQMLDAYIMAINGTDVVVPEAPNLTTPEEILDAAYALEKDTTLGSYTLTGVVTSIDNAYNSSYKNITVTIKVNDDPDGRSIKCYRIEGTGADTLAVGDTITVTGIIKNYNGTVEFDAGTTIDKIVKGEGNEGEEGGGETGGEGETPDTPTLTTPAEIIDAAYALADGTAAYLEDTYTLTGVITEIPTAWNSQHNNISVTIIVDGKEDKPVVCFRLKGTGADALAVGNIITVTGNIGKYYNGQVQFDAGCTLDSVDTTTAISDIAKVIIEGNALNVPTAVTEAGDITLPTVGATYNNVSISWASDNACAVVNGGVVTITLPNAPASVKLTATITCGAVTEEYSFNVAVPAAVAENATTVEMVSADLGLANQAEFTSTTVGEITLSSNKGTNSNATKYYTSGSALRVYAGNIFTISCADGYKILSITITTDTSNGITDAAWFTNASVAGTGTATVIVTPTDGTQGVTITKAGGSGNFRIISMSITYVAVEGGDSGDNGDEGTDPDVPAIETLTISQAVAKGEELDNYASSTEQYYVEGTLVYIADSTNHNYYIADSEGNWIYVYKATVGETTPAIGDTVKFLGNLNKYQGNPQISKSTVVTTTAGSLNDTQKIVADYFALEVIENVSAAGEVTLTTAGANGTTIAWEADNTAIVTHIDGGVLTFALPNETTTVVLTATVSINGVSKTYSYNVSVVGMATLTATKADIESLNDGTNKTGYTNTFTTAAGWKITNAAALAMNYSTNATPLDANSTDMTAVLNGKTSAPGKITSPELSGGITKLSFNYGFLFSDTQLALTIVITPVDGTAQTYTLDKTGLSKGTVYSHEITLGTAITGEFTIEITNACKGNQTGNKERASIWNLAWEK